MSGDFPPRGWAEGQLRSGSSSPVASPMPRRKRTIVNSAREAHSAPQQQQQHQQQQHRQQQQQQQHRQQHRQDPSTPVAEKMHLLMQAAQAGNVFACGLILEGTGEGESLARWRETLLLRTNCKATGTSALEFAAKGGHLECVRALLKHCPGEQVCLKDWSGETPLMWALRGGHAEVAKELLSHRPDEQVTSRNDRGMTPLLVALEYSPLRSTLECVRLLIKHSPRIQVTLSDNDGRTPLMLCAQLGHEAIASRLLMQRSSLQINCTDIKGRHALEYAVNSNQQNMMILLIEAGAKIRHLSTAAQGRAAALLAELQRSDLADMSGAEECGSPDYVSRAFEDIACCTRAPSHCGFPMDAPVNA